MKNMSKMTCRYSMELALAGAFLALSVTASAAQEHPTDSGPIVLDDYEFFFVDGEYVTHEGDDYMKGAMYVEHFTPEETRQPVPIVMIHGGGQTGTNFMGTPDGRRGWAHDFLRAGYEVYVVDQPGRARSGQNEDLYGDYSRSAVSRVEERFTAPAESNLWPQAARHEQWPGSGKAGDPAFDQFYASQVASIVDGEQYETLNRDAGVALLDRIGPAILLVHSQSGPFGWTIADARPDAVKAIVSIEPNGPPLRDVDFKGEPDWFGYGEDTDRAWGVSRIPLAYEPAASSPEDLDITLEDEAESENLVRCHMQTEPARQLPNLQGIPILIVSAEASYHATYDHCTARYLEQAGVENEFVRLEDHGLSGNGHMIMIERNNHEVADFLIGWLDENLDTAQSMTGEPSGEQPQQQP